MSEQLALTIDDAEPQGEWTVVTQNRRVLTGYSRIQRDRNPIRRHLHKIDRLTS